MRLVCQLLTVAACASALACGGETFESAGSAGTGGGDASAGDGGDGGGGASGAGAAGAGGATSGGASGDGGGSGTGHGGDSGAGAAAGRAGDGGGAGLSGAGGGGPAPCPGEPPAPLSLCEEKGQQCQYPSGCCEDVYSCSGGTWRYQGCVTVPTACPDAPPEGGDPCDPCGPAKCQYDRCDSSGVQVTADCTATGWKRTDAPCIACQYGHGFVDQFDRACNGPPDCEKIVIGNDCCGTALISGIASRSASAARAAWATCVATLPQCGCPSGLPVADDGLSAADPNLIAVTCSGGQCRTKVP